VCFVVRKTTLEIKRAILTTLYLIGIKNTDSWRSREGDLQHTFPLDVSMVPSSVITVTADDECLTCGGFYLGKTVHLGSFEFIADYFSNLSLYPMRGDSSAAYMGSTLFRTRPSASSRAEANDAVFYASTLDTLSHASLSTKVARSFTSLM
jgi:hypothetical protein